MTKSKMLRIVNSSLLIASAFLLCAALGMLINPDAFHKFFSPVQLVPDPPPPETSRSYYWDLQGYADIVLNNSCLAFYPLWPLLIRILFHPQNVEQAAHNFLLVSTVIFFLSIPLLIWVFSKSLKNDYLALLSVLAFYLSPIAIFRVIGYTESLFSVLSVVLIWLCLPQTNLSLTLRLILVFFLTLIMGLTRPILIPFILASLGAIVTIFYFESLKINTHNWSSWLITIKKYVQEIKITLTLWISSLLAYSIYGFFCWQARGDFFAPFKDQKNWGTKLGLHLELLLIPKSQFVDLLGLYFPLLVLLIAFICIYCKIKKQNLIVWQPKSILWNILFFYPPLLILTYIFNWLNLKNKSIRKNNFLKNIKNYNYLENLSANYIFWFCVYFPVIHSLIIFFTRDRLYSLGRYIFGVPFFFLALGYLCCCIPGKKTYQTLWWFIGISAVALVEQWVNYGQNKWLG